MTKKITTKQNIVPVPAEWTQRAIAITGQNLSSIKPPLIRLDHAGQLAGIKGEYVITDSNQPKDKDNKPTYVKLGKNFNCIILKIRSLITSKGDKNIPNYYSYETKRNNDIFILKLNNQEVDRGSYKELKTKYPNIVYNIVLYVLLTDKKLARLKIKYPSTQEFWNFEQSFSAKDPMLFWWINCSAIPAPDTSGIAYFLLQFKKAKQVTDYEQLLEQAEELDQALQMFDNSRNKEPQEDGMRRRIDLINKQMQEDQEIIDAELAGFEPDKPVQPAPSEAISLLFCDRCADMGVNMPISKAVSDYSIQHYGRNLCKLCQNFLKNTA